MLKLNYNWKRYWCPVGVPINLSFKGYLLDPNSEDGRILNQKLVNLEQIIDIPCLILLGEPGTGKSTAIKDQYNNIQDNINKAGGKSLSFDLRAYQTDIMLVKSIFENDEFIEWKNGSDNLHLFLDSLDECLLRISSISALLNERLQHYPVDRLNLIIACRTADWPSSLEKNLINIWGNNSVKIFELAPLRQIDVYEAAKAHGLDPDQFIQEVENKEVVPLAIKPITVEFLLNIFKRKNDFPSTQVELYEEGCRILCEDDEERRETGLIGNLSTAQRITAASRIAAITMICNKYAIWTAIDRGDVPESDVTIRDICGGKENVGGTNFEIDESAINEVLKATGLFSYRGNNRLGWSHQTYAEFLAARYLVQCKMEEKQITGLIAHTEDPDSMLVPQLYQTASWIANMNPNILKKS